MSDDEYAKRVRKASEDEKYHIQPLHEAFKALGYNPDGLGEEGKLNKKKNDRKQTKDEKAAGGLGRAARSDPSPYSHSRALERPKGCTGAYRGPGGVLKVFVVALWLVSAAPAQGCDALAVDERRAAAGAEDFAGQLLVSRYGIERDRGLRHSAPAMGGKYRQEIHRRERWPSSGGWAQRHSSGSYQPGKFRGSKHRESKHEKTYEYAYGKTVYEVLGREKCYWLRAWMGQKVYEWKREKLISFALTMLLRHGNTGTKDESIEVDDRGFCEIRYLLKFQGLGVILDATAAEVLAVAKAEPEKKRFRIVASIDGDP